MVDAGLTDTSALNTVGVPGPVSGIITSDRALSCNLLAFRAFSTLGDNAVLMGAAQTGRARGRRKPANSNGRKDLII
ncbi:hypothetical protein D3C78_1201130 [compost metagenome]